MPDKWQPSPLPSLKGEGNIEKEGKIYMSNLSLFLKKNKKVKTNAFYSATKSLVDENGEPLKWEIKALTTTESEDIRTECTTEVQVPGKPGMYRQKVDTKLYIAKLIAACVVVPDLYNRELQDSYGVKTPEELLKQMIDNPSEYNALAEFVQNFSGLGETLQEKVEEAKN